MDKLSFEDACFQWASRQFLYEPIPDEYFEWSEPNQHEHLEQHAWEPISHHDGYRNESHQPMVTRNEKEPAG